MRIFDIDGNLITDPDLNKGKIVRETKDVLFKYDIEIYEQGHYITIAEYDNGGKALEWVVDIPESGKWIAYDSDGNEVDTDLIIPDDAPHEIDLNETYVYGRYILYTEEELRAIEEAITKDKKIEEFLTNGPIDLASSDDALCELYETNLAQQDIINTQDEAICELYEMLVV